MNIDCFIGFSKAVLKKIKTKNKKPTAVSTRCFHLMSHRRL